MTGGVSRRRFLAALAGVGLAGAAAMARMWAQSPSSGGAPREARPDSMDFNEIETGANIPNDCTPKIDTGFIGMRIAAPESVKLDGDLFAVCGTYQFSAEFTYSFGNIHRAIGLVVVDAGTGRPVATSIARDLGGRPEPARPAKPHQDPDWMEDHVIQRYFNVDVRRFVDIPARDGAYWIYAVIRNHVSNVVRVEVKA